MSSPHVRLLLYSHSTLWNKSIFCIHHYLKCIPKPRCTVSFNYFRFVGQSCRQSSYRCMHFTVSHEDILPFLQRVNPSQPTAKENFHKAPGGKAITWNFLKSFLMTRQMVSSKEGRCDYKSEVILNRILEWIDHYFLVVCLYKDKPKKEKFWRSMGIEQRWPWAWF